MHLSSTLLHTVKPYVSEALIGKKSFADILEVASFLPEKLTTFFGFECPLGSREPISDFLLRISAKPYGRETLARKYAREAIPQQWYVHPAWQKVEAFTRAWRDRGSALYLEADDIWLEFDIHQNRSEAIPVPSFFFGLPGAKENAASRKSAGEVIKIGLESISGRPLRPATLHLMARIENALPQGARIFQVGTMISRPEHIFRFCIMIEHLPDITPFLERIGWRGNLGTLEERLEQLGRMVDYVALDLDLTDVVGPKIGLECYLEWNENTMQKWQTFTAFLQAKNLCVPEKASGLLSFPKTIEHAAVPREFWPPHYLEMAKMIGRKHGSFYEHTINHIKVNFVEDRFTQAKAYLGIEHYWASIAKVKEILQEKQIEITVL